MAKAKDRVRVEVDGEWFNDIVTKAVNKALNHVNYRLAEIVEIEVSEAVDRELRLKLAAAARKAIKDQLK